MQSSSNIFGVCMCLMVVGKDGNLTQLKRGCLNISFRNSLFSFFLNSAKRAFIRFRLFVNPFQRFQIFQSVLEYNLIDKGPDKSEPVTENLNQRGGNRQPRDADTFRF